MQSILRNRYAAQFLYMEAQKSHHWPGGLAHGANLHHIVFACCFLLCPLLLLEKDSEGVLGNSLTDLIESYWTDLMERYCSLSRCEHHADFSMVKPAQPKIYACTQRTHGRRIRQLLSKLRSLGALG
jgi:hypothetical protein